MGFQIVQIASTFEHKSDHSVINKLLSHLSALEYKLSTFTIGEKHSEQRLCVSVMMVNLNRMCPCKIQRGVIENLVGRKSHQQTDHMQMWLRAPADISSLELMYNFFIHLVLYDATACQVSRVQKGYKG